MIPPVGRSIPESGLDSSSQGASVYITWQIDKALGVVDNWFLMKQSAPSSHDLLCARLAVYPIAMNCRVWNGTTSLILGLVVYLFLKLSKKL